jgi:hypothetical protein
MQECDRYEDTCKGAFKRLFAQLDGIDESLRGNGKPGLNLRVDRLEHAVQAYSRMRWLAISATASGVVSLIVGVILIAIKAWK